MSHCLSSPTNGVNIRTRITSVVFACVSSKVVFFSFKLYPEASSGWRFDRAYLLLRGGVNGAEERTKKLWERCSSRRGVLIIINRRTYCFGCPSRRRSVSRAAVGAKSLLYYVIKTGNLTAANGKSPTAAAAATTVTRSMASNYYYRV